MSNVREANCCFCKSRSRFWDVTDTVNFYGFDCPICHLYFVSGTVFEAVKSREIDNALLWCISENIKTNRTDYPVTTSWHSVKERQLPTLANDIVVKRFEDYEHLSMRHADKPKELLLAIAEKVGFQTPFTSVGLELADLYRLKINGPKEAIPWLLTLKARGWLESPELEMARKTLDSVPNDLAITPAGWATVDQLGDPVRSNKVFIAMQFEWPGDDKTLQPQVVEAIKLACRDCGYEGELVSDPQHIDQITDRIVAGIRAARFVVSEFTYNNRGVYYEAGFGRGLGRSVIHTVKRGHASGDPKEGKQLHFDIRQINYIEWDDPTDLRVKLKDRIAAVIGLYGAE